MEIEEKSKWYASLSTHGVHKLRHEFCHWFGSYQWKRYAQKKSSSSAELLLRKPFYVRCLNGDSKELILLGLATLQVGSKGIVKLMQPTDPQIDEGNPAKSCIFVLMKVRRGFATPNFVTEALFCRCGRLAWEWAKVKKLHSFWRLIKLVCAGVGILPRMTGRILYI